MKTSACLAFFALAGCVLAIKHGEPVSDLADPGQVYGKNYILAIDPKDEKCLEFEYQIKPVRRKLRVALKIRGAIATQIWSAAGCTGKGWKRTSIGIHESEIYRIAFRGVRYADRNGPVAIRYITVNDGPCNAGEPESGLGDPGQVYGKNYIIAINPKDEKCLKFEYRIKPAGRNLTVALKMADAIATPIWSAAGGGGKDWNRTSIGIYEREQKYRIVFEGVRYADRNDHVAIRYVTIKDGPCDAAEPQLNVHLGLLDLLVESDVESEVSPTTTQPPSQTTPSAKHDAAFVVTQMTTQTPSSTTTPSAKDDATFAMTQKTTTPSAKDDAALAMTQTPSSTTTPSAKDDAAFAMTQTTTPSSTMPSAKEDFAMTQTPSSTKTPSAKDDAAFAMTRKTTTQTPSSTTSPKDEDAAFAVTSTQTHSSTMTPPSPLRRLPRRRLRRPRRLLPNVTQPSL